MSNFGPDDARVLHNTLLEATVKCSERGLVQSAKWAAELTSSIAKLIPADSGHGASIPNSTPDDPREARLEAQEFQRYLLAKSYFDCREFDRCASVFLKNGLPKSSPAKTSSISSPTSNPKSSPWKGKGKTGPEVTHSTGAMTLVDELNDLSEKAIFLALFAKYLAGEKRKDEENEMILGPADRGTAVNKELVSITQALEMYIGAREGLRRQERERLRPTSPTSSDVYSGGWLEYLYGVILAKGKNEDQARYWLIRSVLLCPYNWSAWQELNILVSSLDELQRVFVELQPNVTSLIFNIYARQELSQYSDDVHTQLTQLERIFPDCAFLQTQRALLYYHAKEFQDAESIFSSIITAEPYRLDSLDQYSNILYVMGNRPKLAFIAQLANAIDKFRPETCTVIGNYFSIKSEHEKAVQYFRRALQLDRSFLSAWTLMGHEFVEMKNTHAAIESYRRAVDVNRKDYRAWYGLGQTYELLEMHLYGLFYYQRAAALRPYDSKMWHAVGSCYDRVGRPAQAIKAFKRALVAGNCAEAGASFTSAAPDAYMVVETLYHIALLYEKLNNREQTAQYMEMTLAQEEGIAGEEAGGEEGISMGTGVTATTSKARIWLARYEAQRGSYARAMELANELCQDGVEVEEAKALIRDIRARQEAPSP